MKEFGKATHQSEVTIDLPQQQRACVRGDVPPSKPATTERRATASNSNSFGIHSVRIGLTLDHGDIAAAQRFSQICSFDAPTAFEKSGLKLYRITASAGLARYHARFGLHPTGHEFRHKLSRAIGAG